MSAFPGTPLTSLRGRQERASRDSASLSSTLDHSRRGRASRESTGGSRDIETASLPDDTTPLKPERPKGAQVRSSMALVLASPLMRSKGTHTMKTPVGYTYHDDPRRKRTEVEEKRQGQPLFAYSVHSFEAARQHGSVKRMPWDRVRPVTRTYGDFWSMQV